LVKKSQPSAKVIGIDIDPTGLKIAKGKAAQAGVDITFDLGTAFKLPYPENYFDRVVSSLIFHHLTTENKVRSLKEALRVLKPKGELHIADLGKPRNLLMHLPSKVMRHLEESEDNIKGLLPHTFRIAGFEQVKENAKFMTMVGTIALYEGQKP